MLLESQIKIPFGYKRVWGKTQEGDGIWNGAKFLKVKKEWPAISKDEIVIRRCEVIQEDFLAKEKNARAASLIKAHQYLYYVLSRPIWSDKEFDDFCRLHNIRGIGGSDRSAYYSDEIINLAQAMLKDPGGDWAV